jgi:hypothetical protein
MSIVGPGSFRFIEADVDFDGVNDLDVAGESVIGAEPAAPPGTYVRIYPGAWNVGGVPPGYKSDPDLDQEPDSNPVAEFGNSKSFRVAGFVNPPGAVASTLSRTFATAVVSPGSVVRVQGELASEVPGFSQPFDYTIPEPASLTFVGLGALGLMGRRRRA